MHFHNASAEWSVFHSAYIVGKEEHLTVANVWNETRHSIKEAWISYLFLVTNAPVLQVFLPWSTEWGIRDAEVKLFASMAILTDSRTEGNILMVNCTKTISKLIDIA